ncbi:hypothetical protein GALL_455810 [mine drainage metagenome]|uniref:Uncharacterized protein n=1 Tax=mine drainage metagenome TaxID=410659 RepID=A0A1J5PYX4_9ZZZZ
MSGGKKENRTACDNTARPQPTAQPDCTEPTARPRYCGRIASPISTAPAAHSPPKPRPSSARAINSWSKFCTKAQTSEKTENQRIVSCKVLTRPMRSARKPPSQPPMAEASNVTVPARPALPGSTFHSAMMVPITSG